MSAFRGKADVIQGKADIKKCPLMTQSGQHGNHLDPRWHYLDQAESTSWPNRDSFGRRARAAIAQLLGSIANRLLGRTVICSCFWRVSFLLLARFEEPLSAGAVCVFLLRHKDFTPSRPKFRLHRSPGLEKA
jgi:hypothetical protein